MPPPEFQKVIVVQTAFPGDVILTLPLVQALKHIRPSAFIDVLVIPGASAILKNHPAIRDILVYDKRNTESGIGGFLGQVRRMRARRYDVAFIPHRSFRSAALAAFSGIPRRIGFETSAGRFLLTDRIRYKHSLHEVDRNLSLLEGIGLEHPLRQYPDLYPSDQDRAVVDDFLRNSTAPLVGIAPGTVWRTKQWLPERFAGLVSRLSHESVTVILIGGESDRELCDAMVPAGGSKRVLSAAGKLTLLQSAELIRRCAVLVSNDSAPMHCGVAMRTPVVAIFGATVPAYGFAPYGESDVIVEINGLSCRPCSIHGGAECPIHTFECMKMISSETVFEHVASILTKAHGRQ